jgi:subtilisin family serine protease
MTEGNDKSTSGAAGEIRTATEPHLSPARGLFFEIAGPARGDAVLDEVSRVLGPSLAERMDWKIEQLAEEKEVAIGLFQERVPQASVDASLLSLEHSAVVESGTPMAITLQTPPTMPRPRLPGAVAGDPLAAAPADWYWPASRRLPKSAYGGAPDIRVAHIDTGVSNHPCLRGGFDGAGSMSFFYPNGEREGRGVICWGREHPYFISHGTGTGGLIIGERVTGLPLDGMTPRGVVETVPCRVSDEVVLFPDDVERLAEAIHWAVDQGDIRVMSISLGDVDFKVPQHLKAALQRAHARGVIVCCAAGQLVPGMVWPAAFSRPSEGELVICCGVSRPDHMPDPMSAWIAFPKDYVTIAAPGVDMPRAYWREDVCSLNQPAVITSEGTSYSTAYSASVAALWWARNWDKLSKMDPAKVVPLFRSKIQGSCYPWARWPGFGNFGPGILNPNGVLDHKL